MNQQDHENETQQHNINRRTISSVSPSSSHGGNNHWKFEIMTDVQKLSDYSAMAKRSRTPSSSSTSRSSGEEIVQTSAGFFSRWQIGSPPNSPASASSSPNTSHPTAQHWSNTSHHSHQRHLLQVVEHEQQAIPARSRVLSQTGYDNYLGLSQEIDHSHTFHNVYTTMFTALVGEEEVNRIDQQYRASRLSKSRNNISIKELLNS